MALYGLLLASQILHSILLVDSGMIQRRKREESEDLCPRLEFLTDHHGCQPCTLCESTSDPRDFRTACKAKHPHPIPHHGGQVLWCDNPDGQVPECPALHQSVLKNCTSICKDRNRQFAPGCECSVSCLETSPTAILCTRDLQWNNSDIPTECQPPSPTTITATEIPITVTTESAEGHSAGVIPVVVAIVIGILIIFVISFGIWWRWRRQRKRTQRDTSHANGSIIAPSVTSNGTNHSTAPLLIHNGGKHHASNGASDHLLNGNGHAPKPSGTLPGASEIMELKETAARPVAERVPVHEATQNRETGQTLLEDPEHVSPPTKPPCGGDLLPQGKPLTEDLKSKRALQALMRDRKALRDLTAMFDQTDSFDRITWRNIAVDWLGWERDAVRSTEYLLIPAISGGIPGDGPTYKVLEDAYSKGKGLIGLIEYLQRHKFRNFEAEKFLWTFYNNWMKTVSEHQASC